MQGYLKDMLVRAKLQFEGFDNATQQQKPHWESVRPVFAFPYEYKIHGQISENEITFLDTVVFKGKTFIKECILEIKTHYKPTETFQYTHSTSCHPQVVKEALSKAKQ